MELSYALEKWPIRGAFVISRGSKIEAVVVHVTIRDGEHVGHGEGVPYARYGETAESVQTQIESVRNRIESREQVQGLLPAGAARNAIDCALWDLDAKRSGKTIWEMTGIVSKPLKTAYTIVLAAPEKMAASAAEAANTYSLLKIKLGGEGDGERLRAVRVAAPRATLIVDVNEGWTPQNVEAHIRACEEVGVVLIEQPLPAEDDTALADIKTSITICADESVHTAADIQRLIGRYSAVNIKLDKTGGLTEALLTAQKAKEAGLLIMVGCMVSTSFSIAPATVVAQLADYVDLDGPLLLEKDREPGIQYQDGMVFPITPHLWG